MYEVAILEVVKFEIIMNLQVPQCIVVTAMRPDMALFSKCECIVYFTELTIPFGNGIEEAFERKKLKYAELVAEARQGYWLLSQNVWVPKVTRVPSAFSYKQTRTSTF